MTFDSIYKYAYEKTVHGMPGNSLNVGPYMLCLDQSKGERVFSLLLKNKEFNKLKYQMTKTWHKNEVKMLGLCLSLYIFKHIYIYK